MGTATHKSTFLEKDTYLHAHTHEHKNSTIVGKPSMPELLNDAVYLRIFIYKGTKTKLGSVFKADQMQSNGPTLRSLANFHIELEQFCCSLTAA